MGKSNFQRLTVWQKSKDLAVLIYSISNDGAFARDFGLRDQIRRSAVSVPSNIAEGNERETDKEAIRFFYIARGSAAELLTQMIISAEIGYVSRELFANIEERCLEISRMLSKLISARSLSSS